MKITILLIACCLISASLFADEEFHITVSLMTDQAGSIEHTGSSVGFRMTDRKTIVDKFWWTPEGRGSSRRPNYESADSASEISFDLFVNLTGDRFHLVGDISKWKMASRESGMIGARFDVGESMPLDSAILIDVGKGWGGEHYFLSIEASTEQKTGRGIDWSKNEIYIEVEQLRHGKVVSSGRNGRARLLSEQSFPTGFSSPAGSKPLKQLHFEIKVSAPGLGSIESYPFETEILIEKVYRIDIDPVRNEETIDFVYRSEYRHKIELRQGKQFMIVIPPDTPSVEGFDISTKLFITPGLR